MVDRWKKIQKELIEKAARGEKGDIVKEEISYGTGIATAYADKLTYPSISSTICLLSGTETEISSPFFRLRLLIM